MYQTTRFVLQRIPNPSLRLHILFKKHLIICISTRTHHYIYHYKPSSSTPHTLLQTVLYLYHYTYIIKHHPILTFPNLPTLSSTIHLTKPRNYITYLPISAHRWRFLKTSTNIYGTYWYTSQPPSCLYQSIRHHNLNHILYPAKPSFPHILLSHPRYTTELYTLLTHLCQQIALLIPHFFHQQMAVPSLHTLTYFTQRQTLTHASLPQGDGPAGLGAAQTSIFFGERPPPKNTYGGGPFQSPPPPQKYIRRGRTFPYPNVWASADPLP